MLRAHAGDLSWSGCRRSRSAARGGRHRPVAGSPRPRPRSPPRSWPPWSGRRPPVVRVTAPPVHDRDHARVLAFGGQVDTRPVRSSRRTDDPNGQHPPAPAGSHRPPPRRPRGHPGGGPARAVRAARQMGAHPRVPRPLRDQVPPLLAHPRPAPPREAARPGPHSRSQPRRHPHRPAPARGRAPRRRPQRDHRRHRLLGLRRLRLGQRRRDRPGHRGRGPRPRVRPGEGGVEAEESQSE